MHTTIGFPYHERVKSNKTEGLFIALTGLFLLLGVWRVTAAGLDLLAAVFFALSGLFLFYSVNYRALNIHITPDELKLTFGIFSWTVAMENIDAVQLDEIPVLLRLGGAGIHFMMVHKRYRASFNFLEYPRIVVALKKKVGPVQDISFTTRRPDEVLRLVREEISARAGA